MNSPIASKTKPALPSQPTNVIFTGVAGTGKTHRLLSIQQIYDEIVETSLPSTRVQQLKQYTWCDVVCAVLLLEDRLMTVPEMIRHPMIIDKMTASNRKDNVNQTLWVQLNTHAHPDSKTVNYGKRSANFYFDKTNASQWYILDDVKDSLQLRYDPLMSLYSEDNQSQASTNYKVRRSCLVSFHPSYGYDEFVEGIRPQIHPQTGQMQYEVQLGAFVDLCRKAAADPQHRYAMLIDEINRANTAQVFGELMSVIEPTKRTGGKTPMSVRLAYSGRQFSVPSNVDIYATMNTQDHSLATLDAAFRRRFEFISCQPDPSLLHPVADAKGISVDMAQLMSAINNRLMTLFGTEAQLGHSYFMDVMNIQQLASRLYKQIIPQIQHHIQQHAVSSQMALLLAQVLYGMAVDIEKIGTGVLNGSMHTPMTHPTIPSASHIQDRNQSLFNNAFEQVANPETKLEFNSESNSELNPESVPKKNDQALQLEADIQFFLSAQPYINLYNQFT